MPAVCYGDKVTYLLGAFKVLQLDCKMYRHNGIVVFFKNFLYMLVH